METKEDKYLTQFRKIIVFCKSFNTLFIPQKYKGIFKSMFIFKDFNIYL